MECEEISQSQVQQKKRREISEMPTRAIHVTVSLFSEFVSDCVCVP